MTTAVAAPRALDLVFLFQDVRIRKSGVDGYISQVHEISGMQYIEVTTKAGTIEWPLCAQDIEVRP